MHKNVSFAKQSIFVMCDILEVYHYVSATHFTDVHTPENQGFVIPIQTTATSSLLPRQKKLFLVPSSRCVLTVGEEERAGNINVISSKQNTNLRTKIMLVNPDVTPARC